MLGIRNWKAAASKMNGWWSLLQAALSPRWMQCHCCCSGIHALSVGVRYKFTFVLTKDPYSPDIYRFLHKISLLHFPSKLTHSKKFQNKRNHIIQALYVVYLWVRCTISSKLLFHIVELLDQQQSTASSIGLSLLTLHQARNGQLSCTGMQTSYTFLRKGSVIESLTEIS